MGYHQTQQIYTQKNWMPFLISKWKIGRKSFGPKQLRGFMFFQASLLKGLSKACLSIPSGNERWLENPSLDVRYQNHPIKCGLFKPCYRRVDGFNTNRTNPSISEAGNFMDDGAAASHCARGPIGGPIGALVVGLDTYVPTWM